MRPGDEPGPLAGTRVLEIAQGVSGPFAGMRLGDCGADVIKLEPVTGDYLRALPPIVRGESAVFLSLNRNKRSVALDTRADAGRAVLARLVAEADVVIEDWRSGMLDARDGYEAARECNPRLVWCTVSPFGEEGPMCDQPGAELVVQAISDYTNSVGSAGAPPVRVGADIAGLNTGVFVSQAITAALFARARSGEGQRVSVSQLGSLLHMRGVMWTSMSSPDDWFGMFNDHYTRDPDHGYATADGSVYWGLRRGDSEDWDRLLIELGLVDRITDPRFEGYGRDATSVGRYAHEVKSVWEEAFAAKGMTTAEVIDLVLSIRGDAVPFNDYETLVRDSQITHLDALIDVPHPRGGTFKAVRHDAVFSASSTRIRSGPPLLGEHTVPVLREAGVSPTDIESLINAGTAAIPNDDDWKGVNDEADDGRTSAEHGVYH